MTRGSLIWGTVVRKMFWPVARRSLYPSCVRKTDQPALCCFHSCLAAGQWAGKCTTSGRNFIKRDIKWLKDKLCVCFILLSSCFKFFFSCFMTLIVLWIWVWKPWKTSLFILQLKLTTAGWKTNDCLFGELLVFLNTDFNDVCACFAASEGSEVHFDYPPVEWLMCTLFSKLKKIISFKVFCVSAQMWEAGSSPNLIPGVLKAANVFAFHISK